MSDSMVRLLQTTTGTCAGSPRRRRSGLLGAARHDAVDDVGADVADRREAEADVGADRREVRGGLVDVGREHLDAEPAALVEVQRRLVLSSRTLVRQGGHVLAG
jgi:hypothetical protein